MTFKQILHRLNRRDTRLLPKNFTLSKIILILLTVFTVAFTAKTILAETYKLPNETIEGVKAKQAALEKGNNQESWINESLGSNAMSIFQAAGGTIPDSVLEGKTTSWIPGGIIGFTNQTIAQLYNPPASGVEYIAQSIDNFTGKSVYAQSTGFSGLSGIQSIWKTFRNAVYVLISIVFVCIGIMIMLRIKISPQAVVSIQSAIPRLITTLILVTFSYAIAGLLIDLSYVVQGLVLSLLFNSKGGTTAALFSGGINPTFKELMNADFGVFSGLTFKAVPFGVLTALAAIPSAIIGGIIAASTAGITFGAGILLGFGVGILALLVILAIIAIFILIQVVKFFFGIAKCYINLILKIILAPLEIGMGAIPNSKMGFSSWLTQTIGYLAVFPISVIFLVLSNMIIEAVTVDKLWAPSILDSSIIAPLMGLSTLMILAKLPNIIPEMVFQIKPTTVGKAIGETLRTVPGVKLAQTGMNVARENFFKNGMRRTKNSSQEQTSKETERNAQNQTEAPPSNNA